MWLIYQPKELEAEEGAAAALAPASFASAIDPIDPTLVVDGSGVVVIPPPPPPEGPADIPIIVEPTEPAEPVSVEPETPEVPLVVVPPEEKATGLSWITLLLYVMIAVLCCVLLLCCILYREKKKRNQVEIGKPST